MAKLSGQYIEFPHAPIPTHTQCPAPTISPTTGVHLLQLIKVHWHITVLSNKESACNSGDICSIPGSWRSPGGWHGNPLQYFCLENPMDRGAWQATVHGVTKSPAWQKQQSMQALKTHCYQQKFIVYITIYSCCQVALVVKNLPAKAEDVRDLD